MKHHRYQLDRPVLAKSDAGEEVKMMVTALTWDSEGNPTYTLRYLYTQGFQASVLKVPEQKIIRYLEQ